MKNMDKADASLILKSIKSDVLASILDVIRLPTLRLSDIRISKNDFNIWKKAGYLDSMFGREVEKLVWNLFSVSQLIVLVLVNMLWERKMNEHIKDYVDAFMNSSELNELITSILEDENQTYLNALKGGKSDLLTYIVSQKKENPNLPALSWIEAIAIASIKIDRPYSLLLFEDGRVEFFSTTLLSDYIGLKFDIKILNETFLNIQFSSIVRKILNINKDGTNVNPYIKNESTFIKRYIANGYDIETLIELLNSPNNIEVEEQSIFDRSIKGSTPPKIEDLVKEKANQDILIRIRDGKKLSIKRLIINKKQ